MFHTKWNVTHRGGGEQPPRACLLAGIASTASLARGFSHLRPYHPHSPPALVTTQPFRGMPRRSSSVALLVTLVLHSTVLCFAYTAHYPAAPRVATSTRPSSKRRDTLQCVVTTPHERLASKLTESLIQEPSKFVRFKLTNYPAPSEDSAYPVIQKLQARFVSNANTDNVPTRLQVVYTHPTSTTTKNYDLTEAAHILTKHLSPTGPLKAARLFTTTEDWVLEAGRRMDKARFYKNKPTFTTLKIAEHDRKKKRRLTLTPFHEVSGEGQRLVDREKPLSSPSKRKDSFLDVYGILGADGRPKAGMKEKFRQIEKFVEILASLLERETDESLSVTDFGPSVVKALSVLDAGCGKGYLTFAAYEYLTSKGWKAQVRGVEMRRDLVDQANAVASQLGYAPGLTFIRGTIADLTAAAEVEGERYDVVIALHACDTATDDCLYLGVQTGAPVIIASPCCHKEIRRQMRKGQPGDLTVSLQPIVKHGILLERQAEIVTDRLEQRALGWGKEC